MIFVPKELETWAQNYSDQVLTHSVPKGSIRLAYTQQITTRKYAKDADIVLSVMNTGPIKLPVPQIIWACNVTHFVPGTGTVARLQNWTVLKAMEHSDICIFPSKSARQMAMETGFRRSSKVLYHPMRICSEKWYKSKASTNSEILKIFVPASNNAHKNLAILPEVSKVLTDKGLAHNFNLTIDQDSAAEDLRSEPFVNFIGRYQPDQLIEITREHDVAFIPSLLESYSYSLAELELMGMPIAASNISVHTEIRESAHLFDPQSSVEAANALVAARNQTPATNNSSNCISAPTDYADEIYAMMKDLIRTTNE